MSRKVLVIAGPTASGKSGLALDLAVALNGVVLNADSMQVYQGMPILSAVPDEEDRKRAEHRLYEIFAPDTKGSVVDWLRLAAAEIQALWQEGRLPIVAGGTGLYLDNLINGTTPIPETSAEVKQQVRELLAAKGTQAVHQLLKEHDPEAAARLSANDTTRVRRAYEVWLETGKTLSEWHRLPMVKLLPEAEFVVIKLLPEQRQLDERCSLRFDRMMEKGALAEAENLLSLQLDPQLPAMKALGVPELIECLCGRASLEEAVAAAKLHTRQYAKRQRTWFARKPNADIQLSECYEAGGRDLKNIILDVKKRL